MQVVVMSIKPEWLSKIISGEKIYEVRKRAPVLKTPYIVYVYCTLAEPKITHTTKHFDGCINGLVCASFICTRHIKVAPPFRWKTAGTCLTARDMYTYSNGKNLTFLEISDFFLFEKPKHLSEFEIKRAPQNYQFAEVTFDERETETD